MWVTVTPGHESLLILQSRREIFPPGIEEPVSFFLVLSARLSSLGDSVFGWLALREAIRVRSKNQGLVPGLG